MIDSTLYYYHLKRLPKCPDHLPNSDSGAMVKLVYAKDLGEYPTKKLLCPDFTLRSLDEYKQCNLDYTLPTSVRLLAFKLVIL